MLIQVMKVLSLLKWASMAEVGDGTNTYENRETSINDRNVDDGSILWWKNIIKKIFSRGRWW